MNGPATSKPLFPAPLLCRVGLVWLLVSLLMLATNAAAIAALRFPDSDDTLRLVQVRDLLAGQGWFDLHQYRIDPGSGGVLMHWSRLVDAPIAAAILVLRPLLGQALAEHITLVLIPLVTLGCALLLAGRLAWRLFGGEITTFVCLALALLVPLQMQLRPLRIDHHGWQIVAALVAVNGLLARSPRRGALVTGLALAVGLSISVEGLPLAAAFAGIAALHWLRDPQREGTMLVHLMLALAGGSAALFVATRGIADLAQHCDAISPVYLAIFGWGAAALTLLWWWRPGSALVVSGGFAVTAGGALAILLTLAPQCAGGPFGQLDPLVRRLWYDNVLEGLPLWHQPLAEALQSLVPLAIGLMASLRIALSDLGASQRRFWIDYSVVLATAIVVAVLVSRAAAVAGALAALPLGWQIHAWLKAARGQRVLGAKLLRFAAIALVLLPALPLTLYGMIAPALPGPHRTASIAPSRVSSCRIAAVAPVLRRLPIGDILAPLDIGPRLVYETRHTVVATSHHRAGPAMRTVIDAFTGSPDQAHAIAERLRIEYVALCPDLGETALLRQWAPDGFAARLSENRAPAWLEPVPIPANSTLLIWRVVR